jgi:hypothetical protein
MRIALVDPSRTTRLIVARMLEARGHDVVPFADEREAIDQHELCWETPLIATSRRPIYVLMMSSQYDQRSLISSASLRSPRSSMRDSAPPSASHRCSGS